VIDQRYKRSETVWMDSYKRASYAQKIAMQLDSAKMSHFTYLAALLADIGYIVMLTMRPKLFKRLQEIAGFKGIKNSDLIEEISLGLSHSTLGGMILKKWSFNDSLIKTIEYHQRPHMAPKNLKQLIYIVYLADCMVEIDKGRFRYELIDEDVTDYFNISGKQSLELLHKTLREAYEQDING